MDLDKGESLEDTESESDDDDPQKAWKVLTKLNEQDKRNLKKAGDEQIARGLWQRQITNLESLRASKRQKREERKEDIDREQEGRAEAAEVRRLKIATARARMPKHRRDIKKCLDILPQIWKKGARKNVIERVKNEMSMIWPTTEFTEFEDREVTQIFKIRYTPKNEKKKVPYDQYHALLMKTEQGEEEDTTVKKTKLLKRLSPIWMRQRFDAKFRKFVQTASSRPGMFMKWIYVPSGDAGEDVKAPSNLLMNIQVHYTQKNHDTCLSKSMALALHHLNKKRISSFILCMATKYTYAPVEVQLNHLCLITQEKDCKLLLTKWMTKKRVAKLDLKIETSDRWALVVVPLGGDGGIGHAITIVGNLIFDSTQTHALKLGKDSLDWCCAYNHGFESIYMAVKFAWEKKHQTFNIEQMHKVSWPI
jgi:hypothetical protein